MAENNTGVIGCTMLFGVFVLGLIIGILNLYAIWAIIPGSGIGTMGLAAINASMRDESDPRAQTGPMTNQKWITFAIIG